MGVEMPKYMEPGIQSARGNSGSRSQTKYNRFRDQRMNSGAFAINKEAPEGATKMPKGIKIVDKK